VVRAIVAVEIQAGQEFARDMLGIAGAIAIAGKKNFSAVAQRVRDRFGDAHDRIAEIRVFRSALEGFARFAKVSGNAILIENAHVTTYSPKLRNRVQVTLRGAIRFHKPCRGSSDNP
jgi:hypothetical protein